MKFQREKIKQELIAYGLKVGYPDKIGPKEFIEYHINPFFKHLIKKGLVKPEWYNQYREAAILMYQFWYMRNR